jgi:hypothetical protein
MNSAWVRIASGGPLEDGEHSKAHAIIKLCHPAGPSAGLAFLSVLRYFCRSPLAWLC